MSGTSSLALVTLLIFNSLSAQPQRKTAWDALIQEDAAVIDDPAIGWHERLVLHVLTPDQARLYYRGAGTDSLVLENGMTLTEYLSERLSPPGSVYVPLPVPCPFFKYQEHHGPAVVELSVYGEDLSLQGGSATGCPVPEPAVALMLQVKAQLPIGVPNRFKLWPSDGPEPSETLLQTRLLEEFSQTTAVVPICLDRHCREGGLKVRLGSDSSVQAEVLGYFRPINSEDSNTRLPFTYSGTNTYDGTNALSGNTGTNNTAFGNETLSNSTSGNQNTALGSMALQSNAGGSYNTAVGVSALTSNSSGHYNTAVGRDSMKTNTTGFENTAVGNEALKNNQAGYRNTAVGDSALYSNTDGHLNTAVGEEALWTNALGNNNSALGHAALKSNFSGSDNTAVGYQALHSNWSGGENTAVGRQALEHNTLGARNTALGYGALQEMTTLETFPGSGVWKSGEDNTAIGHEALASNQTGDYNTVVGSGAGEDSWIGSENSYFGHQTGQFAGGDQNAFFGAWSGKNCHGSKNAFLGYNAGNGGTFPGNDGSENSFFGSSAGYNNTLGYGNSFLGYNAGHDNSSGSENTFIGAAAGLANTKASGNTFVGVYAGLDPGLNPSTTPEKTNATAIGHRAWVSQSNSLVLGSIAGFNGATDSVGVGIGTPAPSAPLHVSREDGSSRILVEDRAETTAVRTLFQLDNNGAPRFAFKNASSGIEWSFQQSGPGNFLISKEGTGGPEMQIYTNGRVRIGPGGVKNLELDPSGNLTIKGTLTANGSTFPDYVFQPGYTLMPLSELRTFIQREGRLPGIPSANEVEKQGGHNMTTLQIKLLEKIEELTLYVLHQQAEMARLEEQLVRKPHGQN